MTQFGRAMEELGVKLTCVHSPQAKGHVERMNGTLQDRLVKALRIAGISDLASANAYLQQTFLPQLNARFTVQPACAADVHRPTTEEELDGWLCFKDQRKVGRDQCVRWEGRIMQLLADRKTPSLAGRTVQVRRALDGRVTVVRRGQVVAWQVTPPQPRCSRERATWTKPTPAAGVTMSRGPWRPAANHPWRGGLVRQNAGPVAPQGVIPTGDEGGGGPHARSPVGVGSAAVRAAPSPALRQPQPAI